jgi:hypothetical protein
VKWLVILPLLCGCAILPRGPIASHSEEHFSGRADGLILRERWTDESFTRGRYFLADPDLSKLTFIHSNQPALGGGSFFSCGTLSVVVDSNTPAIISAGGTAVGNVVGAAVKTAVKP